jgi:hypothetical protein
MSTAPWSIRRNFDGKSFVDRKTDVCIIPPNSFALARTVEYFRVPRDVLVICLGKSTYARCGIIVNVTPLEPGWEGHVTLEFSNTTPLPAKIYANEGACQFLFLQGNQPCETSYADRAGKYMGQKGVTLEILPNVDAWEAAGELPRSLHKKAAEAGILGLGLSCRIWRHGEQWLRYLPLAGAERGNVPPRCRRYSRLADDAWHRPAADPRHGQRRDEGNVSRLPCWPGKRSSRSESPNLPGAQTSRT